MNIRLAKRLGLGMIAAGYAMHEVSFLQDLAVVMIAAGIVTVLFQRLKQPVVLGYIVAGILIGPHFSTLILCLLYTSPSPRDATLSRMPSSA